MKYSNSSENRYLQKPEKNHKNAEKFRDSQEKCVKFSKKISIAN